MSQDEKFFKNHGENTDKLKSESWALAHHHRKPTRTCSIRNKMILKEKGYVQTGSEWKTFCE